MLVCKAVSEVARSILQPLVKSFSPHDKSVYIADVAKPRSLWQSVYGQLQLVSAFVWWIKWVFIH